MDTVTGESDTANNCSVAVTVVVNAAPAPAPDLVIDTPTVSDSSPTAGAFFTLNATVRNRGKWSLCHYRAVLLARDRHGVFNWRVLRGWHGHG